MLGGVQRHGGADLVAELARPHACGIDDRVCTDRSELGLHADGATGLGQDALDLDVLEDLDASGTSTLGECLCHVDRIDDAVVRQVHAADQVVDSRKRHEVLHVLRGDDVDFETEHARCRCTTLQFLEALLVRGDRHRTALLEAGRLTGLGFEGGEQVRRVLRETGEVVGRPQLADESGRVPGGARGELLALEKHDVGDPALGEVVGDAAADDSTAHDDDAGIAGQIGHGL